MERERHLTPDQEQFVADVRHHLEQDGTSGIDPIVEEVQDECPTCRSAMAPADGHWLRRWWRRRMASYDANVRRNAEAWAEAADRSKGMLDA